MKIGILGGGNVGGALGVGWAKHGHQIVFGVRDPAAADTQAMVAQCNGRATVGIAADAAGFGEVVVNALPWPATQAVLTSLDLRGKTLLDATNPFLPSLAGIEVGTTTSGGELVSQWAAGAHVVKIFNTTGANNMANPVYSGEPIPMFYCGDNADAKTTAAALAKDLGFAPVDVGPLSNSRVLEPLALLWVWLAYPGGLGREFAFQIVKR
ncbi:MAG: NAD(P)-binding domain-containing protein [Bryobacteraceae bacterium]|jgi:predicted dinucleotide-binding enzyme